MVSRPKCFLDVAIIIIIIIIIFRQCLWCCHHYETSPGSFGECRLSAMWLPTLRPSQSTWTVSYRQLLLLLRRMLILILLFHGAKAESTYRHCSKGMQLVLNTRNLPKQDTTPWEIDGKSAKSRMRYLPDKNKQNCACLSTCRYCSDRTQNLSGLAPNNVLTVLQISSNSVHFRRSYSRTRDTVCVSVTQSSTARIRTLGSA